MKARIAFLFAMMMFAVANNFSAESGRLVLTPGQRLQLPAITAPKDSFEVQFTLAVPDSLRLQRHRCCMVASSGYTLRTSPAYQWALRDTTAIVLSTLDLSLRAKADSTGSFQMRFDFVNLDYPERNRGTALLAIGKSDLPLASLVPLKPDLAGKTSAGLRREHSSTETPASVRPSAPAEVSIEPLTADSSAPALTGLGGMEDPAQTQGKTLLWVMITVIVLGVLLLVVLSVMSGAKSREFNDYSLLNTRPEPEAKSARRKKTGASSVATPSPGSAKPPEQDSQANRATAGVMKSSADLPIAANRLSFLYKEADEQSAGASSEVAGMNLIVSRLCEMTAATQQALAAQHEMLERLAKNLEPENGNAALPGPASGETSESHGTGAPGWIATPLTKRWDLASDLPASGASLEEIVEAIDGVVAASASKPLLAPPSVTALKIDSLRRAADGLQKIAAACRQASAAAEAEAAENLRRKAAELALSYEAWVNNHAVKLSLNLPGPGQSNDQRKKILDSLLDGLYETRKMAVQGPIYFDRRLSQLMNDELPKLRLQTEALDLAGIKNLWEEMR